MNLNHPINCLTFNAQRAARSLVRGIEAAMKDAGLSAPQFTTLTLLSGFGSQSVTQLAERLGTERTTVTRNLLVMTRKGWIAPVQATDQRLHIYALTDAGRAQLARALPAWSGFQQSLVTRLGKDKAEAMLDLMQTL